MNKLKESLRGLVTYESPISIEQEWDLLQQRMDKEERKKRRLFFFLFCGLCGIFLMVGVAAFLAGIVGSTNKDISADIRGIQDRCMDQLEASHQDYSPLDTQVEKNGVISTAENRKMTSEQIMRDLNRLSESNNSYKDKKIISSSSVRQDIPVYIENAKTLMTSFVAKKQPKEKPETIMNTPINDTRITPAITSIIPIARLDMSLVYGQMTLLTNPTYTPLIEPIKPVHRPWSLMGYSLFGYQQLSYLGSLENPELRDDIETPLEVVGGGLQIVAPLYKGLSIIGGADYVRMSEEANLTYFDTTAAIIDGVPIGNYTRSTGEVQTVYGSTTSYDIYQKQSTRYAYSKSINLSLGLQYVVRKGAFEYSLSTLAIRPVCSSLYGNTLLVDGSTVPLSDLYSRTTKIQLGLGAGVRYSLIDRWSLALGYQYRSPINQGARRVSSHLMQGGIQYSIK